MRSWQGHPLKGDLGRHAAEWDALNKTRFNDHPLLDSRFWNGLLRHFKRPGVMLWELRDCDTVLAMCLLERTGWGRWGSYLPGQAQLGPVMIHEAAMVDELLAALRPMALQVDLLCVDPDICRLDPEPGRRVRTIPHAMTMNVLTGGPFEDYWEHRSTALRQNLRRYERQAEKAGVSFTHRVIDRADAVAEGVVRYAELESKGWKGAEGTALAPGNEQARFYTELLAAYAATGQAAVQEFWAGDELAAS
ncbi:MAG TPA: GNAT family N-acetyltransferase, partial [Candidatus Eisenbacteria bacterium]